MLSFATDKNSLYISITNTTGELLLLSSVGLVLFLGRKLVDLLSAH